MDNQKQAVSSTRKVAETIHPPDEAITWMTRGIALLRENTHPSLEEAVRCFDQAIELRRARAPQNDPWLLYGLAAAWMNRGDALTRLGPLHQLGEAVRSYDEALSVLRDLPFGEHGEFQERLAIAWMNRGVSLQAQGSPGSWREAIQSFDQAIAVTRHREADLLVPAAAWMNRGNALLRATPPLHELARAAARQAIRLVVLRESDHLASAEIGLNARHVLCRAIADSLAEDRDDRSGRSDVLAEATDVADAAMVLVRTWESRGVTQFRQIAREVFRFGHRVYQMFQPQFLTEFLLENLDPQRSPGAMASDRAMHAAAAEALQQSVAAMQTQAFSWLNTPRFDRLLEDLHELRLAEARLSELRRLHLES